MMDIFFFSRAAELPKHFVSILGIFFACYLNNQIIQFHFTEVYFIASLLKTQPEPTKTLSIGGIQKYLA